MEKLKNMPTWSFLILMFIFYFLLYCLFKMVLIFSLDYYGATNDKSYLKENTLEIKKYSIDDIKDTNYIHNDNFVVNVKKTDDFIFNEEYSDDFSNFRGYLYTYGADERAYLVVGEACSTLDRFTSDDNYFLSLSHFPYYYSETLRKYFLSKHDINNDIDLIKYLRSREKFYSNFFTPIIKAKENFYFNIMEENLPDLTEITYITGDYDGYILGTNNFKQAIIYQDGKHYFISFSNLDYFDDEKIVDIIKSIIITKN